MNYFDSTLQEKTILDILTFDLSTFFYGEYEEVNCEELEGTFLIDYEKKLPWVEFETFDYLRFRVFNDKKNIHGSNHINASLVNRDLQLDNDKIRNLVEKVYQIYGMDDFKKGKLSPINEKEISDKTFMRVWTTGKTENLYTIKIGFEREIGFSLSIILFTNLLRETADV